MSIVSQLPADWEIRLEEKLIRCQNDRLKKKAYICSPCRASTADMLMENMVAARFYMFYALDRMGCHARAPHAYLPAILNDTQPHERALALRFGREFMECSDVLFVCGQLITAGMRGEIEVAAQLNMPIVAFDHEVHIEVRKIVTRQGGDKRLVSMEQAHPWLGLSPGGLLSAGVA